jgi:hypothetical protein
MGRLNREFVPTPARVPLDPLVPANVSTDAVAIVIFRIK